MSLVHRLSAIGVECTTDARAGSYHDCSFVMLRILFDLLPQQVCFALHLPALPHRRVYVQVLYNYNLNRASLCSRHVAA